MADITRAVLHFSPQLDFIDDGLFSGWLWKQGDGAIVDTIHDVLAVEGAGAFVAADVLGEAGKMEGVLSATINKADIGFEFIVANGAHGGLGYIHLLYIITR